MIAHDIYLSLLSYLVWSSLVHPCCCITLFHSFLWLSSIPLYMCTISLFTCHWPFRLFHVLAIVNRAVNIGVYVSFWIIVLSGYMHRNRIAGSHGNSIFCFWDTSILFFMVAAPTYITTNCVGGFLFLYTLYTICHL